MKQTFQFCKHIESFIALYPLHNWYHAKSSQNIDTNIYIGNGKELESQDDQDSIGVSGIEAMVMPMVCMKLFQ